MVAKNIMLTNWKSISKSIKMQTNLVKTETTGENNQLKNTQEGPGQGVSKFEAAIEKTLMLLSLVCTFKMVR